MDVGGRQTALGEFLQGRPDKDQVIAAIAGADPLGAPQEPHRRIATLADLDKLPAGSRFVWDRWIVRGHLNLLTSDPKVGKTCLAVDLSARIYRGSDWPDGAEPTFDPGTKTLWICGDRHQQELRERASAYGLPLDAVLLNAWDDKPTDGCTLDDEEVIKELRQRVERYRPGLVIIDTLWRATQRKLYQEVEANLVVEPLIDIAQKHDVAILALTHLSRDKETLGRRLNGIARSIMMLDIPDLAKPELRRLSATGNHKSPMPLGMTITDTGCVFDSASPEKSPASKGGRPATKAAKAELFLESLLAKGGRARQEAVSLWEADGGSKNTLVAAAQGMERQGRLLIAKSNGGDIWSLPGPSNPEPDEEIEF
jgi:hypothetical protein